MSLDLYTNTDVRPQVAVARVYQAPVLQPPLEVVRPEVGTPSVFVLRKPVRRATEA